MEIPRMDQNSRKGIVFGYRTVDVPTSSSGTGNRSEEMKGSRLDPVGPRKDTRYVAEDDHSSHHRVNDWVRRYNLHERSDSENLSTEKDFGYSNFSEQPRIAGDQGRHPYYAYPDEGPSSKTSGSLYGYGEKMWNNGIPGKPSSEPDQVEILRTLDELKDQVNRYCGAMDKPRFNNERPFPDRYYENIQASRPISRDKVYPPRHELAAFEDQFHAQINRKPHDQSLPHEYDLGRRMDISQFSHHSACACFQCVPARNPQSSFDRVGPKDFLGANLHRIGSPLNLGPHNSSPHGSDYAPSRDVRPRERWTSDPESDGDGLSGPRRPVIRRKNEQYCRSVAGGAPFISCYNCFELLKLPRNLMKGKNKLQCGACSFVIDVQIEKKRVIVGSPKESESVSSELDKDFHGQKAPKNGSGDFADSVGKSVRNFKNSGQKSTLEDREPKLSSSENKQSVSLSPADRNLKYSEQKSTLEDQGLKVSSSEKKRSVSPSSSTDSDLNLKNSEQKSMVEDQRPKLSLSEKNQSVGSDHNLKNSDQKSTPEDQELKFCLSEKNQSVGSDHNLKNSDQKSTPEDQELKFSLSEKKQSISSSSSDHNLKNSDQKSTGEARELKLNLSDKRPSVSSSSDFSEEEESPSPPITQGITSNSAKPASSPPKNSPLFDEQSDHLNSDVNIRDKVHFSQNSLEDVSESMESEDSFDEYPHTQTSQDSIEAFRQEDQNKNINDGGIHLADRVKKRNVFVNGHPIPDDLVRKAERLAGSVLPGDYWYDYKAGFWGVIGNPCLGIVPPFIEEFNYPMPTNCAAGNTGVYVNGRQLHQNDLDLLSGRGLPTISDRFYTIDISGKVVDEDSGEELYYLGKLAPTIEKMKRGFGMKVPKSNV